MIQKINFNPIAFRGYSSSLNEVSNPIDNQPREFNSDFYVDKNGADAIKARNFVNNPTEINKPIAYDDYVKQLKNANLIENRDYVLEEYTVDGETGFYVRIIRNGNQDKTYKTVFWANGKDVNNFGGYEDTAFPINNNEPTIYTRYDKEGILESNTLEYDNPDEHKDLFPENIDINTTSDEYIKWLDSKNIKYDINRVQIGERDSYVTSIHELDNEDREVKSTTFFEYPNGDKSIMQDSNPGINGMPTHGVDIIKEGDLYKLLISENVKYQGNTNRNTVKY